MTKRNLFLAIDVGLMKFLIIGVCLHNFRCSALLPGLYCGEKNCYDVLNVNRESSKTEIAKSYRKLAAKFHPDKQRGGEEEIKKAEEQFRLVAVAYETLRDDDTRKDYDYLLDNPDELYRHYYYYYRHRYAPKVDVRYVILATVVLVSVFQYISAWHKYNEAISYLLTQPKYRLRAVEIAKERGLIKDNLRKGKKKRDKEEVKEEEEAAIRSIIEENVDVRGGYSRPSYFDLLIVQIVIFPYYLFNYVKWYVRWIWKFNISKEEFGEEEKFYIIRRNMKMSQNQFDCLEASQRERFLADELWIKENFDEWKHAKDEDERRTMAESAQHKRYRRYMRNHGPGQISFLED